MKASTKAIFSLFKQHKRIYVTDAILMLVSNTSEALIALFFGLAIGSAVAGSGFADTLQYLLIAFGLGVFHSITWHLGDYLVINKVYKNTYELRDIAFRYIWKYDYPKFIDKPSSKIATSANRLQENLRFVYDSLHYGFFSIGVYYLALTASVITIAWQNSLTYLIFMVLAVPVLVKRSKRIANTSARMADHLAEVDGKVYDSTSNFTNVFSFNAKNKEIRKNSKHVNSLFATQYAAEKTNVDFWVVASAMVRVGLWAAILGTDYYLLKTGQLDQTGFAAAVAVLVSFTGQYWNLVHHISAFGSRLSAYKQNYDYLFDCDVVGDHYSSKTSHIASSTRHLKRQLSFDNVSFAYPDAPGQPVLDKVSFTVQRHQKVGIVGKSGGGKSTLIKLLLGFYEPTDGRILVDDQPVSTEELSRLISYVPQDTTLFQETIAYNIGYAIDKPVSQDEVIAAAKKAHAHEFITQLKDGYDTLVGERGVKLSLGQRQRIALARAFLKDTDLLILDEATSSLDSKTEKDIQDSLEELWKHKTVIAIAHRLSTLNNVNFILVVDEGRLVESGTKGELLNSNGLFAELWHQQKNGLI